MFVARAFLLVSALATTISAVAAKPSPSPPPLPPSPTITRVPGLALRGEGGCPKGQSCETHRGGEQTLPPATVTIQTTVGVTCTITSTVISDHTYTQTLYDTKVLTSTEVVKDSEEVTVWVIEPSPIVRSTEVTEYHTLVITDVDVSYYAETMPGTAITSVHKSKETVKATTTPCDTPSVIQSKPEPTPTYEPTTWSNATEEQPPQTSSASLTRDAWTHVTQSPAPESKPSTDLRPGWLPVDSASSGHCGSDGKQCHGAETTQVASESQTTSQVNVLTTLRSSPVTTSQAATSTTVLHEPHSAGHTVGVSTIGVALVVFLCSFLLVA